jgi:hypothetical protein
LKKLKDFNLLYMNTMQPENAQSTFKYPAINNRKMAVIQITGIFGAGGHEGLAINKEGDVMS